MLVVSLYLAYTIYEADHDIRTASSFYADLGVTPSATEREIKSRFRRLAALHHPDKAGTAGATSDAADYFIHLKTASETLQDAARRFAYERFGPDVVRWQRCSSVRDYVAHGVLHGLLPHYAVAAAAVWLLGLLGYMDYARFYRWLLVALVLVLELHAVTRPRFPALLDAANALVAAVAPRRAPYLPFQMVALARKLTITCYIALSQLGPVISAHLDAAAGRDPAASAAAGSGKPEEDAAAALDRLDALADSLDRDASRLIDTETAPFKNDNAASSNLRGKMREWLVQNTIRADPMVRDAVGSSFRRRRIDAPAGTRATR